MFFPAIGKSDCANFEDFSARFSTNVGVQVFVLEERS